MFIWELFDCLLVYILRVCLSGDKYNLYQIQCKTMSWETSKRQMKALHFSGFYKNVETWWLFSLWDRYQMILDLFFWQSPETHRQMFSINMFTFIPSAEAFIEFSCEVNVCCQTLLSLSVPEFRVFLGHNSHFQLSAFEVHGKHSRQTWDRHLEDRRQKWVL